MKFLLNTINKFKNRNSKINRASINYRDSKHLGVLYKYVDENEKDYNGKRMTTYHTEIREIKDKIDAYQKKFFEDNDMAMSFIVPKSRYSCHQRARLVTSEIV